MKKGNNNRKIAIVLSGCGNKDGAEIHEAVSLIVALSQAAVEIQYFAPDLEFVPVNFLTNEQMSGKRNVILLQFFF